MTQDVVEHRIRSMLGKIFDLDPGEIRLDARFAEDLGADSLHKMELLMALEDAFHLTISESDAQTFLSAQDVIAYVRRQPR